jgi:Helix-turn-helix domain
VPPERLTPPPPAGLALQLNADALKPLVELVVAEALAQLDAARAALDGKMAYPEAEAAALLSLQPHQLRDERRRGRIAASIGPGRKVLYRREDLVAYLMGRRWEGNGTVGEVHR